MPYSGKLSAIIDIKDRGGKKLTQNVPFNDLSRIPADLRALLVKKSGEIVVSGNYILGPEVSQFEIELAEFVGADGAVGVATGTDAILLALLAAGVGPSDVVMTMPNAGAYTTVASRAIGAEPVFVDVSPDTLQMTLYSLRIAISKTKSQGLKPKVVVVTHLFGQLNSEITEIVDLAKSEGLVLIEDCAQAIGATNGSKMAGSFGELATFSFFPTKNLGAAGDAGAITGSNTKMLQIARQLRQYGWASKYSIEVPFGRNSRLDELQAAILRIKLPHVMTWNQTRRKIYTRYQVASGRNVKFFSEPNPSYVGHLCPITVEGMTQQDLLEYFAGKAIAASVHFPVPDNHQKIELKYRDLVEVPNAEHGCARLVTLPLFPEMTDSEINQVCSALTELGD